MQAERPSRSHKRAGLVGLAVLLVLMGVLPAASASAGGTLATISGTVTDPEGDPIAGAEVVAFGSSSGFGVDTTDDDGNYSLSGLLPDIYQLFVVPPEGSGFIQYAHPELLVLLSGESVVVDVVLGIGGEIFGTITGPGDVPLPAVQVEAFSFETGFSQVDVTDVNGDYSITGLPSDTYDVFLIVPDAYGLVSPGDIPPQVVTSGEPTELDIELVEAGRLVGSVTGPGPAPVPGTEIQLFSEDFGFGVGYSGLDGAYTIGGLAPGLYQVAFFPPENSGLVPLFWPVPVAITSGADTVVDAVLEAGGAITGALTVPSGTNIDDVFPFALDSDGFPSDAEVTGATYAVPNISSGDYFMVFDTLTTSGILPEFFDDSLMPAGADVVSVASGATTSGIDGLLERCMPPFSDVDTFGQFCTPIHWLEDSGIAGGYADGTFRPTNTVTRGAIASFLWKRAGAPAGPFPDPGYSDVTPSHPFYTAISWLTDEDIAGGYPDGTFRSGAAVSRQAAAAFLWRDAGQPHVPPIPPGVCVFDDVCSGHPFAVPIAWMAIAGIAGGFEDGTFRPTNPVSRQAMASFLFRDQLRIDFDVLFPTFAAPAVEEWTDVSEARAPWCPAAATGGVLCP